MIGVKRCGLEFHQTGRCVRGSRFTLAMKSFGLSGLAISQCMRVGFSIPDLPLP